RLQIDRQSVSAMTADSSCIISLYKLKTRFFLLSSFRDEQSFHSFQTTTFVGNMKRFFFFSLSIATVFQRTIQDCIQCSADQPRVTAPHANVWRPLSQEEVSN